MSTQRGFQFQIKYKNFNKFKATQKASPSATYPNITITLLFSLGVCLHLVSDDEDILGAVAPSNQALNSMSFTFT